MRSNSMSESKSSDGVPQEKRRLHSGRRFFRIWFSLIIKASELLSSSTVSSSASCSCLFSTDRGPWMERDTLDQCLRIHLRTNNCDSTCGCWARSVSIILTSSLSCSWTQKRTSYWNEEQKRGWEKQARLDIHEDISGWRKISNFRTSSRRRQSTVWWLRCRVILSDCCEVVSGETCKD